jgi:hypothetical protein
MGSHNATQTGYKFLGSQDTPALASRAAETIDVPTALGCPNQFEVYNSMPLNTVTLLCDCHHLCYE